MRALIESAGFHEIDARLESRSIAFDSFAAYFRGTENGAGLTGQEFVRLPADLQRRVRDEVRQGLGIERDDQRVVIEMDVMIGSGRR
jgi:hypothetical protein